MTHPLTPREKVRKAIIDVMRPKDADITLGRIDTCTDAILTALASGSGDHAELVESHYIDLFRIIRDAGRSNACKARAVSNYLAATILAENAALRERGDRLNERCRRLHDQVTSQSTRATEAERKLAEAVGLVERSIDLMTDEYADTKAYREEARTFLSKEAERG